MGDENSSLNINDFVDPRVAQAAEILGVDDVTKLETTNQIRKSTNRVIRAAHPDQGGSKEQSQRANVARDILCEYVKSGQAETDRKNIKTLEERARHNAEQAARAAAEQATKPPPPPEKENPQYSWNDRFKNRGESHLSFGKEYLWSARNINWAGRTLREDMERTFAADDIFRTGSVIYGTHFTHGAFNDASKSQNTKQGSPMSNKDYTGQSVKQIYHAALGLDSQLSLNEKISAADWIIQNDQTEDGKYSLLAVKQIYHAALGSDAQTSLNEKISAANWIIQNDQTEDGKYSRLAEKQLNRAGVTVEQEYGDLSY